MTEPTRPTGTTEEPAPGTTDPEAGAAGGSADPAAGGSGETELSVEERAARLEAELAEERRKNAQLLAEKSNQARRDGSNGADATAPPRDAAHDAVDHAAETQARELYEQFEDGDPAAIKEVVKAEARRRRDWERQQEANRVLDSLPEAYRAEARQRWESGNYKNPALAGESAKDAHDAKTYREELAKRDGDTKPQGQTQPTRPAGYAGASDRSVSAPVHKANGPKLSEYTRKLEELQAAGKTQEAREYMQTNSSRVVPDG